MKGVYGVVDVIGNKVYVINETSGKFIKSMLFDDLFVIQSTLYACPECEKYFESVL